MTNRTNHATTLIFLTATLLCACGDTTVPREADAPAHGSTAVPYPDEPWDPGAPPWEDCMDGYGEDCEEMYGSGSTTYDTNSLCAHGEWDAQASDGAGRCICDEGYATDDCSECDTGFTMTPDGCVSE